MFLLLLSRRKKPPRDNPSKESNYISRSAKKPRNKFTVHKIFRDLPEKNKLIAGEQAVIRELIHVRR
ncbi:MAG: hypothetical protein HY848_14240 [Betaproteobacteria bacterium]|nr:hypothetical protein [Betaproteobacteria bacterium]